MLQMVQHMLMHLLRHLWNHMYYKTMPCCLLSNYFAHPCCLILIYISFWPFPLFFFASFFFVSPFPFFFLVLYFLSSLFVFLLHSFSHYHLSYKLIYKILSCRINMNPMILHLCMLMNNYYHSCLNLYYFGFLIFWPFSLFFFFPFEPFFFLFSLFSILFWFYEFFQQNKLICSLINLVRHQQMP